MTLMQALALGGGEIRSEADQSREQIRLVSDLQGIENSVLRSTARLARLRSEMAGQADIDFPHVAPGSANAPLAAEVFAQEKTIFTARANEVERQTRSLNELRELLNAEINVLEQKIVAADSGIATAEKALEGVKTLVEKGIAIASRQSDLELALANHRANRLDQVTAIMRARQSVAEATRNLDGLHDSRQTEIASDMQREQSALEQVLLKRDMTQKLLLDLLSASAKSISDESRLTLRILRQEDGRAVELPAVESTPLRPGDVVKATFERSSSPGTATAKTAPLPDEVSQ
jgi:polysaccharide export outer membrane protein